MRVVRFPNKREKSLHAFVGLKNR